MCVCVCVGLCLHLCVCVCVYVCVLTHNGAPTNTHTQRPKIPKSQDKLNEQPLTAHELGGKVQLLKHINPHLHLRHRDFHDQDLVHGLHADHHEDVTDIRPGFFCFFVYTNCTLIITRTSRIFGPVYTSACSPLLLR